MIVGWFLFKHLQWPSNIIFVMSSTGLMGGSFLPWSISYFGDVGLQYYVYQELYNVIHIFGTVFAFAFYFLKVKAPYRTTIDTGTVASDNSGAGGEEGGPKI